jgi:hypothetical protein
MIRKMFRRKKKPRFEFRVRVITENGKEYLSYKLHDDMDWRLYLKKAINNLERFDFPSSDNVKEHFFFSKAVLKKSVISIIMLKERKI